MKGLTERERDIATKYMELYHNLSRTSEFFRGRYSHEIIKKTLENLGYEVSKNPTSLPIEEIGRIIKTYLSLGYNIEETVKETNFSERTIRKYVKKIGLYIIDKRKHRKGKKLQKRIKKPDIIADDNGNGKKRLEDLRLLIPSDCNIEGLVLELIQIEDDKKLETLVES